MNVNIVINVFQLFMCAHLLQIVAPGLVTRENERLLSVKLLSETPSNHDERVRRDADSNLPDQLDFQVPMHNNADIVLRMKRSRLIPTVTSHAPLSTSASENAAVYTDEKQGASMIVKRDAGEYNLRGSFMHDDTEWSLEPLERTRREAERKTHRMVPALPQKDTISFVGDAIQDTEPPVEILSLTDRNRHRLERLGVIEQQQRQDGRNDTQRRDILSDTPHASREGDVVRSKRQAVEHIVEMAFVVDHADYQRWVAFSGASSALSEMRLWYTYVAEAINIRYRTISDSSIRIGTVVTFLKILTNDGDDDFIEDLIISGTFDGGAGLDALRDWVQVPANGIPNADHYMYFTGFDLRSASGVAFVGRVCTAAGVSITENSFSAGTAAVAAHELGHSLLAEHDGENFICDGTAQYIMAVAFSLPVRSSNQGNPWRFSSCSVSAFKTYLGSVSCTEPQNTGNTDELPAPTGDDRAGVAVSRDEQCRMSFRNSASSYCDDIQEDAGGESSLCSSMYCSVPSSPNSCRTTLPLEYTTCGTGKWCRLGFCINVEDEPPEPPRHTSAFQCIRYLFSNDIATFWSCYREVYAYNRRNRLQLTPVE